MTKQRRYYIKDAYMQFYHTSRLLYLEPDALCVGLGAGLLQVIMQDVMNCGHYKMPDNATLQPTALPAKFYCILTSTTAI